MKKVKVLFKVKPEPHGKWKVIGATQSYHEERGPGLVPPHIRNELLRMLRSFYKSSLKKDLNHFTMAYDLVDVQP